MRKLLAAALMAALAVAPAHASAPEPAAQPARNAELDRLVHSLVPDDKMIALATRSFDYAVESGKDGAEAKALYARHPGLREHVADKLRPAMRKIMKRALPGLRKDIAAIISADMTAAEIHDVAEFFASPTGRKVYAAALDSMGDKPDRSAGDASAAATKAVMASLTAADVPAMMKFGASPAAGKMNKVNPKIAAASKAWANKLVAANEAKMRAIAKRATDRYVARAKRSKA